jgi:hypothetical protein
MFFLLSKALVLKAAQFGFRGDILGGDSREQAENKDCDENIMMFDRVCLIFR